jgi:hypothetical protein
VVLSSKNRATALGDTPRETWAMLTRDTSKWCALGTMSQGQRGKRGRPARWWRGDTRSATAGGILISAPQLSADRRTVVPEFRDNFTCRSTVRVCPANGQLDARSAVCGRSRLAGSLAPHSPRLARPRRHAALVHCAPMWRASARREAN